MNIHTMNTSILAEVDNRVAATLSQAARLAVWQAASAINSIHAEGTSLATLDGVEAFLRGRFQTQPAAWFIYRGGSHIALHRTDGSDRVMLVTETRPAAKKGGR